MQISEPLFLNIFSPTFSPYFLNHIVGRYADYHLKKIENRQLMICLAYPAVTFVQKNRKTGKDKNCYGIVTK